MTDKPSIAVLPFINMSGDPEQQYFSDGITEDIITELARYHSLDVIARNTSFQFRGPSLDIAAVHRALGVSYVVEGSVRKSGNRVRMTAQLIDAASQAHIWAERYDRNIEDIFAVQDELTRTVAATLVGRVTASGAEQTRRKPTKDWVAYDYFLQGRECDYRYDVPGAATNFARAVELDPEYLQAHAWLAITLCLQYVVDERTETLDEAAAHAKKALMLDPNDAQAHDAMGYVALRRQKLDVAGEHFDRAVSLNPNDVTIAADRANWLLYLGRLEEALEILDAVLKHDPYSPTWVWEIRGAVLYHLKRFDEAIAALRHVSTETLVVLVYLAAANGQVGRHEDAHAALTRYFRLRPNMTLSEIESKLQPALRDRLLDGLRKAGMPE
jgi:TolB-like protein/Tfp pilus assembly protein PilF